MPDANRDLDTPEIIENVAAVFRVPQKARQEPWFGGAVTYAYQLGQQNGQRQNVLQTAHDRRQAMIDAMQGAATQTESKTWDETIMAMVLAAFDAAAL